MMLNSKIRSIVIDPPSEHYNANRLFDLSDPVLNRDDTLLTFHRMSSALQDLGVSVNTADLLLQGKIEPESNQYFSLGMRVNISALKIRKDVIFKAFLLMEPPVTAPKMYRALPELTTLFEDVYIYNTVGDGYSLIGVDQSRLRKLYCPQQPYFGVVDKHWSKTDRLNRIVVINGNKKPRDSKRELYSKRIEAMVSLANYDAVDLYGRGWMRWWSYNSSWVPYWLNRRKLMSIYLGECLSKHEILSRYRYCLCFENMEMTGYVTEKIFDCLYAGTIPLYLGAPDIELLVPSEAYIDVRQFLSWEEMWNAISSMTASEINSMRDAGREFMKSDEFLKYYDALQNIVVKAG